MKRTHNFFSAAHFATPLPPSTFYLPPVPCNLSPVNWIYTFSAKEKDTETGLSYFGSRYYSSDLSIWLSVDPMASKYPLHVKYYFISFL
jgi:RHS repeat-associated protein